MSEKPTREQILSDCQKCKVSDGFHCLDCGAHVAATFTNGAIVGLALLKCADCSRAAAERGRIRAEKDRTNWIARAERHVARHGLRETLGKLYDERSRG